MQKELDFLAVLHHKCIFLTLWTGNSGVRTSWAIFKDGLLSRMSLLSSMTQNIWEHFAALSAIAAFFFCILIRVSSYVQSNTSYWNQWMLSLWVRQAHGGAYLITRVSFWLVSWFMFPYVHTYREDLLIWFYVTYPAFSCVLMERPYSPLLCPALLQYFGFPWTASIRKVTSDFVFKDSYLSIKMLHSSQYSVSVATQPGFSCNLLALCSITWSWQQIYCKV